MKYTILSLTGLALIGMTAGSPARAQPANPQTAPRPQSDALQLAQAGPVEVYRDQFGREVLVDPYTGEVIAIRQPEPGYLLALKGHHGTLPGRGRNVRPGNNRVSSVAPRGYLTCYGFQQRIGIGAASR